MGYQDYSGGMVIKPSYVPFIGKWLAILLLILFAYTIIGAGTFPVPQSATTILNYAFLAVTAISFLGILVGTARRNAYSYVITRTGIIVTKQLFRRSIRRIPFTSISDVYINQTMIGRLANYGDVVPVTKSGYGLVGDMEYSAEASTAEMTDVPRPDEVAEMIMRRIDPFAKQIGL